MKQRYATLALLAAALPGSVTYAADLPTCSTEKVNGNCVVNIDRTHPIVMPTFSMHPGSHIVVNVLKPYPFETLTLDPQTAQALQGSDQGAAFVTGAVPNLKGLVVSASFTGAEVADSLDNMHALNSTPGPEEAVDAELSYIKAELHALVADSLPHVTGRIEDFDDEATQVYGQLKEIESPVPRPVNASDPLLGPTRGPDVPDGTFDPWKDYGNWRLQLLCELNGGEKECKICVAPHAPPFKGLFEDAAKLVSQLPTLATTAKPGDPPSLPDPSIALLDLTDIVSRLAKAKKDIQNLSPGPDKNAFELRYNAIFAHEQRLLNALTTYSSGVSKIVADLQTYFGNITLASGDSTYPPLGLIVDPISDDSRSASAKFLGRQITYTLFAQNQIATPLMSIPTATQRTALVTITALYADPRFEVASGAFFSSLPNRTFANYTNVTETTAGTPAPVNIKITKTTSRPEVLPFVAANYRLLPEFTIDKRRAAVYASLAVALNPYDTLPEFAGGVSFSWRSFVLSPLYHLGHATHLTQGEYVGEIWCEYYSSPPPSGTLPPQCSSAPPAPTTKTYWTNAIAFGISIRIPTTFGSGSTTPSH
jgi:hypothetical protein